MNYSSSKIICHMKLFILYHSQIESLSLGLLFLRISLIPLFSMLLFIILMFLLNNFSIFFFVFLFLILFFGD